MDPISMTIVSDGAWFDVGLAKGSGFCISLCPMPVPDLEPIFKANSARRRAVWVHVLLTTKEILAQELSKEDTSLGHLCSQLPGRLQAKEQGIA